MDAEQVEALRVLLAPTGFVTRARAFARTLRSAPRGPGALLLVGTPEHEPWHLAAHLADESRYAGVPELSPTLVRWSPPVGAPPHLSTGLARLERARRGEALLVVSPEAARDALLERLHDARKAGATILALDRGDQALAELAHDQLTVGPAAAALTFDAAQHLVSAAAGEPPAPRGAAGGAGLRSRLARLLEAVSGPATGP